MLNNDYSDSDLNMVAADMAVGLEYVADALETMHKEVKVAIDRLKNPKPEH